MRTFIFIILCIIPIALYSSIYSGGGGPNAWYQIPHTPRELAMGRTGIASATGPTSFLWNPALTHYNTGLSFHTAVPVYSSNLGNNSHSWDHVSAMRNGSVFTGSISSSIPVSWNFIDNVAMHLRFRSVNEVARTEITSADQIEVKGLMTVSNYLLEVNMCSGSEATIAHINYAIGSNIRFDILSYSDGSDYTQCRPAGFDIGLAARMNDKHFFGVVYRADIDIQKNNEYIWQSTMGGGYAWQLNKGRLKQIAGDFEAGTYTPKRICVGAEFVLTQFLYPRLGMGWIFDNNTSVNDSSELRHLLLNGGFGITWKQWSVDLAYEYANEHLYRAYVRPDITLSISWNK